MLHTNSFIELSSNCFKIRRTNASQEIHYFSIVLTDKCTEHVNTPIALAVSDQDVKIRS